MSRLRETFILINIAHLCPTIWKLAVMVQGNRWVTPTITGGWTASTTKRFGAAVAMYICFMKRLMDTYLALRISSFNKQSPISSRSTSLDRNPLIPCGKQTRGSTSRTSPGQKYKNDKEAHESLTPLVEMQRPGSNTWLDSETVVQGP
mmetsp:Transcript_17696/g.36725  ORF Transcript_17696/g.36725 Transcript_17696/m.36725 type:complete len:148 (+) Transcript_17696:328-771(+)